MPCRIRRRLIRCSWRWRCCAASAAATSPPRCPTSPSSSRGRRRATRSRSMPASAISASASCSSWCRSSSRSACSAGSAAIRQRSPAERRQSPLWLQNAGFIWVPFIVASAFAAWFGMNDIASAKASFADQAVIFQRKHNWIMCWLYTGTFGSFIGYSAGFPLLAKTQFPTVDALPFVFLGPLVGALSRSATGWISDKWGGGARHLLGVRPDDGRRARHSLLPRHQGSAGRVLGLLRDVPRPVLRNRRRQRVDLPDDPQHHAQGNGPADADGRRRRPASARPKRNRPRSPASPRRSRPSAPSSSRSPTGPRSISPAACRRALWGFFIFYVICVVITWAVYTRKGGLLHDIERSGRASRPSPKPAE